MKNMGRESFPSLVLIIIFLLLCFLSSSCFKAASPSSCSNIRNISCPFTLEGDNQKCHGSPFHYKLSCLDNRTLLYLLPDKQFYVESIDYDKYLIRIVDPGLQKNNYSSFPLHYIPEYPYMNYESRNNPESELSNPITIIECPSPVNSTRYIHITSPYPFSSPYSVLGKYVAYSYAYIVPGYIEVSEMEDNCRISMVTWVSLHWPLWNDSLSFPEIHDGMVYGFGVSWAGLFCLKCGDIFHTCHTDNLDYRLWSCEAYYNCYLLTPRTYTLSITCLRENFHGLIHDYGREWRLVGKIIGLLSAARFSLGIAFLLVVLVYRARRRHLSMYDTIEDFLQGQNNLMPIRYTYSDIKKITNNFRDKLGEGGFGTVYKGKLRSGLFVAVKILGKAKASGQEFINEVATSGRIHHVNVVKLVGFCFEGPKRALLYEFMPNGSLEKYIFSKEGTEEEIASLSWEKIYNISCKVASGIDYLHRGCDMQILHFDIKPHNILLDKNFNPVISDFGLAKLYATDDSILTLTAARGTLGYMAPEMFYKNIGGISHKADVYSFGMLLMEMAGRRKNLNPFVDHVSQIHFPSWVYDQFKEGNEIEMEDATEEERMLVKKMIIVALWCIQMRPSERPSMNKVVEMLEEDIELLTMPPKPFLYPQEDPAED